LDWVGSELLVVDVTEVTSWRERAERAEQRAERAEQRAERAEARVEELVEQVAVLSRTLFGRSSEKAGAGAGGADSAQDGDEQVDDEGTDTDDEQDRAKRGQRPGSKGHGRRVRVPETRAWVIAALALRLPPARRVGMLVTPGTILGWYRRLVARRWTTTARRPGRPPTPVGLRTLVIGLFS
jgi:hypothetical protein